MYVTVGSESNDDVEPDPMRATITEFNPDGTGKRTYAAGTRNPIGLAWLPGTNTMWAAVQERDRLGDDLAPTMSPRSRMAVIMDGPSLMPEAWKTRVTKASAPIWSSRPSPAMS